MLHIHSLRNNLRCVEKILSCIVIKLEKYDKSSSYCIKIKILLLEIRNRKAGTQKLKFFI